MALFYYIVTFIFGLVLGSFYNVVGLRVPQKNFLQSDRSYCPNCKKVLRWFELLPVLSYLIQKGKCRGCHNAISKLYPIIELLTGTSFTLSYWRFGLSFELIVAFLVISLAVIIIVTDSRYFLIPNKILIFFLPFVIGARVLVPLEPWWSPILGAIIGFGLIFLIIIVSKGGMGAGDMKYFALLGIIFGYPSILLVFLLATFYGALVNTVLLLMRRVDRKSKVPFGPYISLAVLTVLIYGESIIDWYVSLFF
ncbi:prepilin peptidase [Amphibacillus jilinensis]|uniref:prepilin peptidase n=1 Tax=Amphibacillus jilinensis TaxID=1216008 RepID=UPI0002F8B269|nr:A24 family peptidase [Amphibacillus jilinensis]